MATAIHVISESTDHYNFALDENLTGEEVMEFLEDALGDEVDYIADLYVNLSDGTRIDID